MTEMSVADIAAVTNKHYGYGDMMGYGNSWIWIILLFAIFGYGGNGFGYGNIVF